MDCQSVRPTSGVVGDHPPGGGRQLHHHVHDDPLHPPHGDCGGRGGGVRGQP